MGTFPWKHCLGTFSGSLTCEPVLGKLVWELVPGNLFLGTCCFAWEPLPGNLAWEPCLGTLLVNLFLKTLLGDQLSGYLAWTPLPGNLFLETLA